MSLEESVRKVLETQEIREELDNLATELSRLEASKRKLQSQRDQLERKIEETAAKHFAAET